MFRCSENMQTTARVLTARPSVEFVLVSPPNHRRLGHPKGALSGKDAARSDRLR